MMTEIWTQYETDLLRTELSNEAIAEVIGRSEMAVRTKRYEVTGHYVESEKQREKSIYEYEVMNFASKAQKEARILKLAQDMRVRLLG